jgi:hypothetical protein
MTDEEIESYYCMIPKERKSRVNSEAVWQLNLGVFYALQEMRSRLAISVLRESNDQRREEVAKAVARIEKQQARLSLRLMECDFERWQEIIKPDYEEWSASVTQLRKYGESDLAGDLSTLISTVRVLVHTERKL